MGCWRFLAVSLINEPRDPLNGVAWMDLFSMGSSFDLTGVRGNSLKTSVFFVALRLGSGVLGELSGVLSGVNKECKISVELRPGVPADMLRVFVLSIELWPAPSG